jgi:hypothetical protein
MRKGHPEVALQQSSSYVSETSAARDDVLLVNQCRRELKPVKPHHVSYGVYQKEMAASASGHCKLLTERVVQRASQRRIAASPVREQPSSIIVAPLSGTVTAAGVTGFGPIGTACAVHAKPKAPITPRIIADRFIQFFPTVSLLTFTTS